MQTVLVAGGAGFIGSHLCSRLLNDNFRVICVDNLLTSKESTIHALKKNNNFTFIYHDVITPLEIDIPLDAIFHLASPASPNHHSKISYHAFPMETMLVNTTGTLELLQLAHKFNSLFLFASTSEVYGESLEHPQTEEYRGNVSTTGPRAVYDEAKRFGETITSYFWREKNVNARIARIHNTFGPGMLKADMRMVIIFIEQALAGKDITIFGDGSQTRSLCFIDDMIEGLMRLMFYKDTVKQIVNLGTTYECSVLDYAKLIKKLTNSSSNIVLSEELPQDDPLQRRPDISKAKRLLQWEPKIDLEEGLQKMIIYLKSL